MIITFIIFIFLGLFAGTIGSIIGLGGGVFVTPGLLFVSDLFPQYSYITPQIAVGTSLFVIIFSSASSTMSFIKQGRVDFSSGLTFFLASGPGVLLGTFLNQGLNEAMFNILFALILFVLFYFLVKNKKMKAQNIRWHVTKFYLDDQGDYYEYGYHRVVAISIAFMVGLVSGMFGIGGGALLVPAMLLLFWFPAHIASATSMFVILLSSIFGSVNQVVLGNIDWKILLWLAPGAWIGGKLGSYIANKINSKMLVKSLRVVLLLLAINALWQGISALL